VDLSGVKVGRNFLDFLIEDKLILELKCGHRFIKSHFEQTNSYLKALDKKLAVLAMFTPKGVRFHRLLN